MITSQTPIQASQTSQITQLLCFSIESVQGDRFDGFYELSIWTT